MAGTPNPTCALCGGHGNEDGVDERCPVCGAWSIYYCPDCGDEFSEPCAVHLHSEYEHG